MKDKKETGFIMLHRAIQMHWIWDDPHKLKWWIDILMQVNHSEQRVNIGYELMECKRGQSLNSLQTWGKRWRVDISTVRRFFKLLESDHMIVTENIKKTTRLTVCNYDVYNSYKQAKQSQNNIEAIAKQSQNNTNNNVFNNESNVKNEKEPPPLKKVSGKWNQKPGEDEMKLELPEMTLGSVVQMFRFTKNLTISNEQVLGLWQVFKVQSFNGEKFYQNEKAVFSHFINWCKFMNMEEMKQKSAKAIISSEEQDNLDKLKLLFDIKSVV